MKDSNRYSKKQEEKYRKYKIRLGLWMFLGYSLLYIGFIAINVFKPELMGTDIGSLNLAIIYGVGLIIVALILAFIYNHMSNKIEKREDQDKKKTWERKWK